MTWEEVARKLPRALAKTLFPFQRAGVTFCVERGGRALLGDEMGLGKTVQALAVAAYYSNEWPLLIVCPSSLRLNWKNELLKWLRPSVLTSEHEVNVVFSGKDELFPRSLEEHETQTRVLIITYDLMTKHSEALLASQRVGVVICDESHSIKTPQAQRTLALVPLLKSARRVLLLSGTPALSRPIELFTQVSSLRPDLFPSYEAFGYKYCNAKEGRWGMEYKGGHKLVQLHALLTRYIMIRRHKQQALPNLLPKERTAVCFDLTEKGVMRLCESLKDLRKVCARALASSAQGAAAAADAAAKREQEGSSSEEEEGKEERGEHAAPLAERAPAV